MIRKFPQPQAGSKNLREASLSWNAFKALVRPVSRRGFTRSSSEGRSARNSGWETFVMFFWGGECGPDARLSLALITDWKSEPKIAGEIASQENLQASSKRPRISPSKAAVESRSAKSSPLMY